MKLYVIESDTNYGTWTMVISAHSESSARDIAEENGAWDGYCIKELVKGTGEGIVFSGDVTGG